MQQFFIANSHDIPPHILMVSHKCEFINDIVNVENTETHKYMIWDAKSETLYGFGELSGWR